MKKNEERATRHIIFLSIIVLIAIYAIGIAVAFAFLAPSKDSRQTSSIVSDPATAALRVDDRSTFDVTRSMHDMNEAGKFRTGYLSTVSENGTEFIVSCPDLPASFEEFLIGKGYYCCLIYTKNADVSTANLIISRERISIQLVDDDIPIVDTVDYYGMSSGSFEGEPFTTDTVGRYYHDESGELDPALAHIFYLFNSETGSEVADAMAKDRTDGVRRSTQAAESMASFSETAYEPSPSQVAALAELLSEPLG